MAGNKLGRPTKLTRTLQNKLVESIKAGSYADAACALNNIDESTYYGWMKRGRAETTGIYREFFQAIKKAAAYAEISALKEIRRGRTGWQSKAWFLERRFRARWGRNSKTSEAKPTSVSTPPPKVTARESSD